MFEVILLLVFTVGIALAAAFVGISHARSERAFIQTFERFAKQHGMNFEKPVGWSKMASAIEDYYKERQGQVIWSNEMDQALLRDLSPTTYGLVSGSCHDLFFMLKGLAIGAGQSQRCYTFMWIEIPDLPEGFAVYKEGFMSKIGKLMGGQDIDFWDEPFDKSFIVKGNDEQAVMNFLTLPRRQALIQLMKDVDGLSLQQDGLCFQVDGIVTDSETLNHVYQRMQELGVLLTK